MKQQQMAYPDFSYHWVLTRQTGSINNISFLYNITHASSVFQWNLWQNTRNKFKLYCRWKVSPMSCYWFVLKGVISLTHSHLICTRLHAISSPFTEQDRILTDFSVELQPDQMKSDNFDYLCIHHVLCAVSCKFPDVKVKTAIFLHVPFFPV
jgi:hypothetical protein